MAKKVPSKKTYKISYIASLIFAIFFLLIGVPTMLDGGLIFVLFGAFFLFLYFVYKKTWMNYDSMYKKHTEKTNPKPTKTLPQPNHVSNAPVTKAEPVAKKPTESVSIPEELLVKPDISKIYTTKEKHHVAGTSYRQKDIKSLGIENCDYSLTKKEIEEIYFEDDQIYELDFIVDKVELIEEPTNEHDPNAIKVVIDGVHVGYIKKGSCAHVKKLMRENKIEKLEADIHGGKYKQLEYDDETDKYSISRDAKDFFVDLYIYKKE